NHGGYDMMILTARLYMKPLTYILIGHSRQDNEVVYLVLAIGSLLVVLLAWRRGRGAAADGKDKLRLPPGPWTLPVIGSMHHIVGALPHRAMRDLARRHGWPVMLLWLGEVPTLVVSSREAAREVMKTHDASFATRPLSSTMRVLTKGGRAGTSSSRPTAITGARCAASPSPSSSPRAASSPSAPSGRRRSPPCSGPSHPPGTAAPWSTCTRGCPRSWPTARCAS
uniref:Uncharacterized protein n=4 Tax=Aegilops tauschii subsp. strangulata TaxID=200361 RepID=A0A453LX19_AEGTS